MGAALSALAGVVGFWAYRALTTDEFGNHRPFWEVGSNPYWKGLYPWLPLDSAGESRDDIFRRGLEGLSDEPLGTRPESRSK